MPASDDPSTAPVAARAFRADSLALGMLVMLVMTIIQRGIGFVRGIVFCRLLSDDWLGQWAMAFGFITLATPLLLLGMPGCLPRYVEHFRVQGHLRSFLRIILLITAALAAVGTGAILALPELFGWIIFRQPSDVRLVVAVGWAILAMIAFNSVNELVAALRQVRVVSVMQFIQSVGFTLLATLWLTGGGGLTGVVLCFAAASLVGLLPAVWVLTRHWSTLPRADTPLDQMAMWRRVLPYAAALWAMNLLCNTFELSDRYMILHFSPGGAAVGQSLVGQYHSSRLFPALLLSLATMIGGVLLPYLAADWEAGRRRAVQQRLKRVLLGVSTLFTLLGAAVLWLAPWLFQTLLGGRYDAGMALLPMVFTFSIWSAIVTIGQDYLWVAERGRLAALVLAVGLTVNLALNALLLPVLGLHGAVVATLVAHGVVLLGMAAALQRCGFRADRSLFWVGILPATLLAGPAAALASTIAAVAVSPHARRWSAEALSHIAAAGARLRPAAT